MKKLSLLLALILCLCSVGCNKATDGTTDPATERMTEPTIEPIVEAPGENADGVVTRYLTEKSERNIISVQYPVFAGEENEDINLLIRNFIFNQIDEWSDGSAELVEGDSGVDYSNDHLQYYVNVGYDITYRANDMISIIFSGNFDLKSAAHPTHVFWSLNIDPLTAAQIRFSDRYVADEELYTIYLTNAQKALAGTALSDVDLTEYMCSAQRFIEMLMQDELMYFYYTEDGVGFSSPVEHVIGDHIEAVIPYDVMESFKNNGTKESPDDPPFDITTAEDYDYICEMAESDVRFKWVKAFIEKDIDTCVDMVRIFSEEYWTERDYKYAEWFEYLNLIEFGDYSAKLGTEVDTFGYEHEYLMFSFEITDSDYDVFPVGTYSYRISEGVMSDATWTRTDIVEPEMDEWFEWSMLQYAHILTLDETSEHWDMASDAIFQIIHAESNVNGITTKEAFKADALVAFGIEDYVPNVYRAQAVDGGYTIRAGGSPVAHYRVDKIEQTGGTTDIYLQFYADPMNTVKAYYVKYSFEKIEGKYPYKLLSVDILDEGLYAPFYWAV